MAEIDASTLPFVWACDQGTTIPRGGEIAWKGSRRFKVVTSIRGFSTCSSSAREYRRGRFHEGILIEVGEQSEAQSSPVEVEAFLSLPASLFEKVAALHDESWDLLFQAC